VENLLTLYQGADLQVETSLNEILTPFIQEESEKEQKLCKGFYDLLWQRVDRNPRESETYLKLIRACINSNTTWCGLDNIQWLNETLRSYKTRAPEWGIIKEICKIFNLLDDD
jgi:hypothetical protein